MIDSNGQLGSYVHEQTVLTYQVGDSPLENLIEDAFTLRTRKENLADGQILQVQDYRILTRGYDDTQIESVSRNIKRNRLLPEVIEKQVKIMYGEGLFLYKPEFSADGKLVRRWTKVQCVDDWLDGWKDAGLTEDHEDFALAMLRRYYYFEDYFVKWRFRLRDFEYNRWVVGLELIENSKARLATTRNLGFMQTNYSYDDFTHVAVGDWRVQGNFSIYPHFNFRDVNTYTVAVSHHANDDVDSFYGRNKSYEGSYDWVEAANENPKFIRSFLRNALAAKVHVIIPNEWRESKKQMITNLCSENRKRQTQGKELLKLGGIEVGTEYMESSLIKYTNAELKKLTEYLSGAENQGKVFSSFSYRTAKGEAIEWKITQLDMKYKEYIEALITFDRRADEVMVGAKGIDPSISNVSKEGIISKSGSDSYYNYIIYQTQLAAPEKICCDAFNMALRVNFPNLYREGFRLGFYRNIPLRQEEISPDNRLTAQQNES